MDDRYKELQKDEAGFKKLSQYLHTHAGIHLSTSDKNKSLMASRLRKVLMKHSIKSYNELNQVLISSKEGNVHRDFFEAMTTNTTHFFREPAHFEFLQSHIKQLHQNGHFTKNPEFRIWCSASSIGSEPYTILMVVLETFERLGLKQVKIRMISTDLDTQVLKRASRGIFSENEVKNIPKNLLGKYFGKAHGRLGKLTGTFYRFRYRSMVRFAQINLLESPYPFSEGFDLIFCRNVLIYFTPEDAATVINASAQHLKLGGILILGHSEGAYARDPGLEKIKHSVYRQAVQASRIPGKPLFSLKTERRAG